MRNVVKQKPINSFEFDKYFKEEIDTNVNRHLMCDYTSIINYHTTGLDMVWGTLWIWDKKDNEYVSPFYHHTWNIDDNDNIYDDYYSLNKIVEKMGINSVDVKRDSYKYVDGSQYTITDNPDWRDTPKINKSLKKRFKTKGYKSRPKMVYLTEVGWDDNDKPITWNYMEKKWNRMEETDIVEQIQRNK